MEVVTNVYVCNIPDDKSGKLYEFYYNWVPISSDSALYKYCGDTSDICWQDVFSILRSELNFDRCVVYFRGADSEYEQMRSVKPCDIDIDVYHVTHSGNIIDEVPDEVRLTWNRVKDSFLQSIAPSIDLDACSIAPSIDLDACIEKIQKNQLSLQASMVADDLDATRLWVGLPELKAEFSRRIGVVVESVVKFIVISRRKPSIGKSRYIITLNALTRDGKQSKAFPFSIGCLSLEPELKKLLPQSESICIKFKDATTGVE